MPISARNKLGGTIQQLVLGLQSGCAWKTRSRKQQELELSQVEIEVQSLRIVAELLGEEADQEEADQEEARKLAGAI